ncbi:MAG TPA: cysteine--tRNA ligase [Candidatus Paceibacterota bacterium]|jgi:cysteinyl-tRNA synthetase|nr:cysteine--tRNA ligase [Candidatus Paceibacterota bacterium]
MWPFRKRTPAPITPRVPLYLHNTLGNDVQQFLLPPGVKRVRMYNCGPTVYGRQHIGNLSMFVFTDILRRTLEYNGFDVKQVINITDVGHLTSDQDEGEDKMSKGLRAEKMALTLENMRVLAEKYTDIFLQDLRALDIDTARIEFPRASDYIPAQIAMIQTLMDKSYAYVIKDGVYFDTTLFADYGELGGVSEGQEAGARVAVAEGKRHARDFALWKFDEKLGWDSPWGKGFPGWHIECSAMIRRCLGEQIDIHTGGIEHIAVHHNNEIAQSEAAIGKHPLSRFWMHREHIQFQGGKLAKSAGNVIYLSDIIGKGFHPLALRYLFLGAHYRRAANFSWDALEAAQTAYLRLRAIVQQAPQDGITPEEVRLKFVERINDDIDTPGALSVIWESAQHLSDADLRALIIDADRVLGLNLAGEDAKADELIKKRIGTEIAIGELPTEIHALVEERQGARARKDWAESDRLRDELKDRGYHIEDKPGGPVVIQK